MSGTEPEHVEPDAVFAAADRVIAEAMSDPAGADAIMTGIGRLLGGVLPDMLDALLLPAPCADPGVFDRFSLIPRHLLASQAERELGDLVLSCRCGAIPSSWSMGDSRRPEGVWPHMDRIVRAALDHVAVCSWGPDYRNSIEPAGRGPEAHR